jgi:hypothetical protein
LVIPYPIDPYKLFYEQQGVNNYYKIEGSYWETMKRLMMVNTIILNDEETEYINRQIDDEFDYNYILQENEIPSYNQAIKIIRDVLSLKKINLTYELKSNQNN